MLVDIPTPEQLNAMSNNDMLTLQQNYAAQMARLKTVEALLRAEVVNRFFGKELREGMNNYDLGRGYELKVTHGYNFTLSDSDKPRNGGTPRATTKALNTIRGMSNEGIFIADRLVKWKPELSITEYRALAPQYKTVIDQALTISDASPKLEIKAPK